MNMPPKDRKIYILYGMNSLKLNDIQARLTKRKQTLNKIMNIDIFETWLQEYQGKPIVDNRDNIEQWINIFHYTVNIPHDDMGEMDESFISAIARGLASHHPSSQGRPGLKEEYLVKLRKWNGATPIQKHSIADGIDRAAIMQFQYEMKHPLVNGHRSIPLKPKQKSANSTGTSLNSTITDPWVMPNWRWRVHNNGRGMDGVTYHNLGIGAHHGGGGGGAHHGGGGGGGGGCSGHGGHGGHGGHDCKIEGECCAIVCFGAFFAAVAVAAAYFAYYATSTFINICSAGAMTFSAYFNNLKLSQEKFDKYDFTTGSELVAETQAIFFSNMRRSTGFLQQWKKITLRGGGAKKDLRVLEKMINNPTQEIQRIIKSAKSTKKAIIGHRILGGALMMGGAVSMYSGGLALCGYAAMAITGLAVIGFPPTGIAFLGLAVAGAAVFALGIITVESTILSPAEIEVLKAAKSAERLKTLDETDTGNRDDAISTHTIATGHAGASLPAVFNRKPGNTIQVKDTWTKAIYDWSKAGITSALSCVAITACGGPVSAGFLAVRSFFIGVVNVPFNAIRIREMQEEKYGNANAKVKDRIRYLRTNITTEQPAVYLEQLQQLIDTLKDAVYNYKQSGFRQARNRLSQLAGNDAGQSWELVKLVEQLDNLDNDSLPPAGQMRDIFNQVLNLLDDKDNHGLWLTKCILDAADTTITTPTMATIVADTAPPAANDKNGAEEPTLPTATVFTPGAASDHTTSGNPLCTLQKT